MRRRNAAVALMAGAMMLAPLVGCSTNNNDNPGVSQPSLGGVYKFRHATPPVWEEGIMADLTGVRVDQAEPLPAGVQVEKRDGKVGTSRPIFDPTTWEIAAQYPAPGTPLAGQRILLIVSKDGDHLRDTTAEIAAFQAKITENEEGKVKVEQSVLDAYGFSEAPNAQAACGEEMAKDSRDKSICALTFVEYDSDTQVVTSKLLNDLPDRDALILDSANAFFGLQAPLVPVSSIKYVDTNNVKIKEYEHN